MLQEFANIWAGDILSLQQQLNELHESHVLLEYRYRSSSIVDILLEKQGHADEVDRIVQSVVRNATKNIEDVASGDTKFSVYLSDLSRVIPDCSFLAAPTQLKVRIYKTIPKNQYTEGECDLSGLHLNDEGKGVGAKINVSLFLDQIEGSPLADLSSTLAHELTHLYEMVLVARKWDRVGARQGKLNSTNRRVSQMLSSKNSVGRGVAIVTYHILGPEQRAFIASIPHELRGIVNDENVAEKIGTAEAATATIKSLPSYKVVRMADVVLKKLLKASGEQISDIEAAFNYIYDKDWTYDKAMRWLTVQVHKAVDRYWRTASKVAADIRDEITGSRQVSGKALLEFLFDESSAI